jgi:hypothetical protein
MVHLVARSTSGGGRPKSGEGDPVAPLRQGLDSRLKKLHGVTNPTLFPWILLENGIQTPGRWRARGRQRTRLSPCGNEEDTGK